MPEPMNDLITVPREVSLPASLVGRLLTRERHLQMYDLGRPLLCFQLATEGNPSPSTLTVIGDGEIHER